MKTKICYIHGFASSSVSAKVDKLKEHFDVQAISYPYADADQSFEVLFNFVQNLDPETVLVGTSLGGFWSYVMSRKFGLSCVLLNPVVSPSEVLKPFQDGYTDFASGETKHLSASDVSKFKRYEFEADNDYHTTVILEQGDALLNYQVAEWFFRDTAEVVVLAGGNHQFENLDVAVQFIERAANTLVIHNEE